MDFWQCQSIVNSEWI
uniref:Uncharacterized protein n=1 Tax=Rhizophora mucronata TaxID=61149 RepID=A0A2P2L608_RHIMU